MCVLVLGCRSKSVEKPKKKFEKTTTTLFKCFKNSFEKSTRVAVLRSVGRLGSGRLGGVQQLTVQYVSIHTFLMFSKWKTQLALAPLCLKPKHQVLRRLAMWYIYIYIFVVAITKLWDKLSQKWRQREKKKQNETKRNENCIHWIAYLSRRRAASMTHDHADWLPWLIHSKFRSHFSLLFYFAKRASRLHVPVMACWASKKFLRYFNFLSSLHKYSWKTSSNTRISIFMRSIYTNKLAGWLAGWLVAAYFELFKLLLHNLKQDGYEELASEWVNERTRRRKEKVILWFDMKHARNIFPCSLCSKGKRNPFCWIWMTFEDAACLLARWRQINEHDTTTTTTTNSPSYCDPGAAIRSWNGKFVAN